MMQDMRRMLGQNKGFTLVEMALVLIIIGIIIGAVVKGKDLVRGAEQKKIYSKYLNEWRLAYLNFYDRTGKILGDTWNTDETAAGQDGQADTANGTSTTAPTPEGRAALVNSTEDEFRGLQQVGLTIPVTNIAGEPWAYRYVDSEGTGHTLEVAFAYDATNNYNYMEIINLPNELALALDTMIDGQADGTDGDFINDDGSDDWGAPSDGATTARWKMQF